VEVEVVTTLHRLVQAVQALLFCATPAQFNISRVELLVWLARLEVEPIMGILLRTVFIHQEH
jgi:hypothetical protein